MFGASSRILLCLLFISVPGQALIFYNDDRIFVAPQDARFRSIGLIKSNVGTATGFLVDDCHVLTNRHVKSEKGNVLGGNLTFDPTGVPSIGPVRGTIIASGEAAHAEKGQFSRDRSGDWILVKLEKCVGALLGFVLLDAEPTKVGEKLMNAGFPLDRSRRDGLTIDPSCYVHYITTNGALHDCAFLPGNSGGPIFRIATEGSRSTLQTIAIGSAGHRDRRALQFDPSRANVATPIAPILPRLRSYLRPIFRGTDSADIFRGSGLIDRLEGRAGNDTFILDRRGGDVMVGGTGADLFLYRSSSGDDHLLSDFNPSEGDILDFSSIDADYTIPGKQRFNLNDRSTGTNEIGNITSFCDYKNDTTILIIKSKQTENQSNSLNHRVLISRCINRLNGIKV